MTDLYVIRTVLWLSLAMSLATGFAQGPGPLTGQKMPGYQGIWFSLGQFSEFGDKYSGGLGTYTAKHVPLAIYDKVVNKTFFVYGGTTSPTEKHLLCMIGEYDHKSGLFSEPLIVHDKDGVDDPHDNPSLLIDPAGFIWVFVSGRGQKRMGYKYKGKRPHSIDSFELIKTEEMTYPQPWYVEGQGYFHFFTKYTGVRELYFETSTDGATWSDDQKLSGIIGPGMTKSGHYQVSAKYGQKLATFFNWHPDGNVDRRTNLYYLQSLDFGKTWTSVDGIELEVPLTTMETAAEVVECFSLNKNVYLKDISFDEKGNPICLYVTSKGHEPGPQNNPREWSVTAWTGHQWRTTVVTNSDHNYDMGSLWIEGDKWTVVGPVIDGPQLHGGGGEIVKWQSADAGQTWKKKKEITRDSKLNHNYVRKVINGVSPFHYFWADGNPDSLSTSSLYFGNLKGKYWLMPSDIDKETAAPIKQ